MEILFFTQSKTTDIILNETDHLAEVMMYDAIFLSVALWTDGGVHVSFSL